MMDRSDRIPSVVVDQAEFNEALSRMNKIDEKIEFVQSEIAQRIGRKVGRDIGIVYGGVAGILIFLVFVSIKPLLFP